MTFDRCLLAGLSPDLLSVFLVVATLAHEDSDAYKSENV